MITDLKKLKKVGDILNAEGTILGLYALGNRLYLASYLTDNTGMVYYSTTKEKLLQYLRGDITLKELYNVSDDFIVSRKFRKDASVYLKQDFTDLIQLGNKYYNELLDGLKHPQVEELINRI